MADNQNIEQFEITLENGEKAQAYEMQPKQTVNVADHGNIASVSFINDTGAAGEDHLLITFENGDNIVLWNFAEVASLDDAPLIELPESGAVDSSLLLSQIKQLNEVEPAAGPEENNLLKAGEEMTSEELIKELNAIEPAAGPEAASAPVQAGSDGFTPGVDQGNDFIGPDVISSVPLGPGNGSFSAALQQVPQALPANAPTVPVAADDAVTATEDTPLTMNTADLLSNDDAALTTVSAVDATTASGGTLSFNPATGTIVYTPIANFNGPDSFTYTATDGGGNTSTATVNINVLGVNDGPDAVNDVVNGVEDTPITFNVLTNDTDVDGDTLVITNTTSPSNGSILVGANGEITYTPNANFSGSDSFTYTIRDDNGATDTATVNINVAGTNDGPDAVNDVIAGTEDTPLVINVLGNDTDLDGDTLSVTNVSTAANGSVVINANGTVTYTPDANFNGTDTFTYDISDGNGGTDTATVTVNVGAVNDGPDAVNDTYTTAEDTSVMGVLVANDSDPEGDSLTMTSLNGVAITGPAQAIQVSNGWVTANPDGTFAFSPASNFNGTTSFTYTVSDGNGGSDTATATINVTAVNDGPNAVDDTFTTAEDTSVMGVLVANDSDVDGDSLTMTHVNGIEITQDAQSIHLGQGVGWLTVNDDGTFSYSPASNFNGQTSFTYTIDDGNGGTDTATATINVTPVNDGPDAVNDVFSGNEDSQILGSVLANDSDADGDTLTVTGTTNPSNGTLVMNADGTFTYTPDANFNGSDSFTYTISDGNGGTDTATVNLAVNAVNDGPNAVDDSFTTAEDTSVMGIVVTNDSDVDGDSLTMTHVNGIEITQDAQSVHLGQGIGWLTVNTDGTFSYSPANGFNGQTSFTYTVDDGNGGTDTATVTLNVTPANDDPNARNNTYRGDEDNQISGNVVNNDRDPDGDTLSVVSNTNPSHGSVVMNADGTFTYTPDANFNGVDTFHYTISDGNGGTDTARVRLRVGAVNDEPEANNAAATTDEGDAVNINVLNNDTDVDGDSLSVTSIGSPSNGSAVVNANGTITYTPNNGFSGADSFTYTVSDGNGGTDTATVNVDIVAAPPSNIDPNANNDAVTIMRTIPNISRNRFEPEFDFLNGTAPATRIDVLRNDFDADGDTLSIVNVSNPAHGSVTVNNDGTITYTPEPGGFRVDSFTYTVSDGNGGTDTATVNINFTFNINQNWRGGVDPLIVDLDGDGVEVVGLDESRALFDMDNDGVEEHTAWAGNDDGFLVLDQNEDGIINDQTELFGDTEQHENGFLNLASYDSNADNVIDSNDDVFNELQIWNDADGDGQTDDGELFTLADLGIESIDLGATEIAEVNNGQFVSHRSTVHFEDGSTGDIDDVWLNNQEIQQVTAEGAVPEEEGGPQALSLGDVVAVDDSSDEIFTDGDGVVHHQHVENYNPQEAYASSSSDLGSEDQSAVFMFNSVNIV